MVGFPCKLQIRLRGAGAGIILGRASHKWDFGIIPLNWKNTFAESRSGRSRFERVFLQIRYQNKSFELGWKRSESCVLLRNYVFLGGGGSPTTQTFYSKLPQGLPLSSTQLGRPWCFGDLGKFSRKNGESLGKSKITWLPVNLLIQEFVEIKINFQYKKQCRGCRYMNAAFDFWACEKYTKCMSI